MYVCIFGQAESTPIVFKILQNQNMWASYDTLEKIFIIQSFAEKASVKRKGLQKL